MGCLESGSPSALQQKAATCLTFDVIILIIVITSTLTFVGSLESIWAVGSGGFETAVSCPNLPLWSGWVDSTVRLIGLAAEESTRCVDMAYDNDSSIFGPFML